jgi:hypothetical protein
MHDARESVKETRKNQEILEISNKIVIVKRKLFPSYISLIDIGTCFDKKLKTHAEFLCIPLQIPVTDSHKVEKKRL